MKTSLTTLAASCMLHAMAQAQMFWVTPLPSLSQNGNSFPLSIGSGGQIGGYSFNPSNARAYIIKPDGAGLNEVGTLGGGSSFGYAINSQGQLVGRSDGFAFITDPNGLEIRSLGTLGGTGSAAYAINSSGQVSGWSFDASGKLRAFITDANGVNIRALQDQNTIGSIANGINSIGQVAGHAWYEYVPNHSEGFVSAFVTGPNGLGFRNVGTLPGFTSSFAAGINDSGQLVADAVGFGSDPTIRRAFISDPEGIVLADLGTLGGSQSSARGINSNGQVVGWAFDASNQQRAFFTSTNGRLMSDLNLQIANPDALAGDILTTAYSINDQGAITASGQGQVFKGYLLTPVAVPEPHVWALLGGLGLLAFGVCRRVGRDSGSNHA